MPEPSDSTPLDPSGKDNSAHDAQHGVAAKSNLLWEFHDNGYMKIDGEPVTTGVLLNYRFLHMDGTENQRRAVRSTIHTRLKPDGADFVTWEDCAGVRFRELQATDSSARIRITFKAEGKDNWYWSALGKEALDPKLFSVTGPTMKLAGLPDEYPPSKAHRGHILHEFGHLLGLEHEHQSPSMEGYLKLNEKAVIKHYGGDKANAKKQVLDRVQDPTNYTRFDKKSIMVYGIPSGWQKKTWSNWFGKKILPNRKLSELDQAFIRLMYPPDLSIKANLQPFLQAMHTAGVPEATAGRMLNVFVENKGSIVERLTLMRNYFNMSREESFRLFDPNQAVSRTIDPAALRRSGVNAFIGEVTKDKMFRAIVKNIVYRTMEQHASGIPTKVSLPGSTQNEVMKMLGTLAMHDDVGHYIRYYGSQFSGNSDVLTSEPPDNTPVEETPKGLGTAIPDVPSSSGSPDSTPVEETPKGLGAVQFPVDPSEWVKKAEGDADARVTKSGRTTIVTFPSFEKRALFDSNSQNDVDVKGRVYFNRAVEIDAGKKAKWSSKWIVFYRGEWGFENFTACFIPYSGRELPVTDLRSAYEDFENVRWEKTKTP